jgi:membrane fusion protein, copper/silver efflux system
MKTIRIFSLLSFLAIAIVAFGAACQKPSEQSNAPAQKYTCPMHPEVVQDGPGKCPKCGMALEVKK